MVISMFFCKPVENMHALWNIPKLKVETGLDFYVAKRLGQIYNVNLFSEVFMLQKPFLLPKTWTNIQCWPVFRGPAKCIRPDSPWPTFQALENTNSIKANINVALNLRENSLFCNTGEKSVVKPHDLLRVASTSSWSRIPRGEVCQSQDWPRHSPRIICSTTTLHPMLL